MSDWIGEQLEGVSIWVLAVSAVVFFVLFYLTLSYFDVRMDAFTLPGGLNAVFTPLGITLLTAVSVFGGIGAGVVRERMGL